MNRKYKLKKDFDCKSPLHDKNGKFIGFSYFFFIPKGTIVEAVDFQKDEMFKQPVTRIIFEGAEKDINNVYFREFFEEVC